MKEKKTQKNFPHSRFIVDKTFGNGKISTFYDAETGILQNKKPESQPQFRDLLVAS